MQVTQRHKGIHVQGGTHTHTHTHTHNTHTHTTYTHTHKHMHTYASNSSSQTHPHATAPCASTLMYSCTCFVCHQRSVMLSAETLKKPYNLHRTSHYAPSMLLLASAKHLQYFVPACAQASEPLTQIRMHPAGDVLLTSRTYTTCYLVCSRGSRFCQHPG